MTVRVTMEVETPDGIDVQGLKEKIATDFEKYGGVRVVKVERVGGYQQMTLRGGDAWLSTAWSGSGRGRWSRPTRPTGGDSSSGPSAQTWDA